MAISKHTTEFRLSAGNVGKHAAPGCGTGLPSVLEVEDEVRVPERVTPEPRRRRSRQTQVFLDLVQQHEGSPESFREKHPRHFPTCLGVFLLLDNLMPMDDQREALRRLIEERREDYSGLSRLLGRNAAYMQQFIKRGTPRRLAEEDARRLARYFGIAPSELGVGEAGESGSPELVRVPLLTVGASAGSGAHNDLEMATAHIAFDPQWLRRLGGSSPARLKFIRVQGDSMFPTLSDGDDILVDEGDAAERLRDGIYVLRVDEGLMVKRLAPSPAARTITVQSDNPAYPDWTGCDPSAVTIIGRVIWVGRKVT